MLEHIADIKEVSEDTIEKYRDDDKFQNLARNKKKHDAFALATSLYGHKHSDHSFRPQKAKEKKIRKNNVHFSETIGQLKTNFSESEASTGNKIKNTECDQPEFYSLSKNYELYPVKKPRDFIPISGVTTDVILFDRKESSEYEEEVADKKRVMRERGVSTNLSNVMTKENMQKMKEDRRKTIELELASLRTNRNKERVSKVQKMRKLLELRNS